MSFKDYLKELLDVSNTDAYITDINEIKNERTSQRIFAIT